MTLLFALTLFVGSCLIFLVEPMFAKMILPLLGGSASVWNTCMVFYQLTLLAGYLYAHLTLSRIRPRAHLPMHMVFLILPLLFLPVGIASGWKPPASANPIPSVLLLMLVSVGLPFLALSTTSSIAQRWFSYTSHKSARDPYFLYVSSNAGSIVGLIGYVVFFEPAFTLSQQSRIWSIGYGVYLALMALCAFIVSRSVASKKPVVPDDVLEEDGVTEPARVVSGDSSPETPKEAGKKPLKSRKKRKSRANEPRDADRSAYGRSAAKLSINLSRLRWIALAFVPSSLTLGFTTSITANIAAVPLLWIVPLTIYLLTFMIAFSRRTFLPHKYLLVAFPAFLAAQMVFLGITPPSMPWGAPVIQLITFFTAALICHKELANDRPGPARLTEFYLLLALGGALGGVFNALIAPLVFRSAIEYPLVLILAVSLLKWPFPSKAANIIGSNKLPYALDVVLPLILGLLAVSAIRSAVASGAPETMHTGIVSVKLIVVILCLALVRRPVRFALGMAAILLAFQIAQPRNDFVMGDPPETLCQVRSFYGIHRVEPDPGGHFMLLYNGVILHGIQCSEPDFTWQPLAYYHVSGPAGQVFLHYNAGTRNTIGLIGLGAGSLAAYAEPGQSWTFYEIDPAIAQIANNPRYFTYLTDARKRGAKIDVKLGDGRLSTEAAPDGAYDLIVVDAFTGDSIPTHLLTSQAMTLYKSKLKPHGRIAIHLSSAFLELRHVTASAAMQAGLVSLLRDDIDVSPEDKGQGKRSSTWMVLARSHSDFGALAKTPGWHEQKPRQYVKPWTDDYSNILSTLRWRHLLDWKLMSQ